jgi:hypothetical protein
MDDKTYEQVIVECCIAAFGNSEPERTLSTVIDDAYWMANALRSRGLIKSVADIEADKKAEAERFHAQVEALRQRREQKGEQLFKETIKRVEETE